MAIVTPWWESVESYIEKGKAIRLARPKSCPSCQGIHFIFWSGYYRYLSSREGEFRVFIRRVRCGKCLKTHSLIPWFLLPNRHSTVNVIGHALWLKIMKRLSRKEISRRLEIPLSTVKGWVNGFSRGSDNLLARSLFLLHSSGANAPPLPPCDHCEGCLLAFQMLFSDTSLGGDAHLFWPYVSLLTERGLLDQHKPALMPDFLTAVELS